MPFQQGGIASSGKQKVIATSGTIAREGFTQEFTYAVPSGTTNRMLVYKFVPKLPGEYRFTADLKTTTGVCFILATWGNRGANAGGFQSYDTIGITPTLYNFNVPIGTITTGGSSGAQGAAVIFLQSPSTTYQNVEGFLAIPEVVPVYLHLTANTTATASVQNLNVYYELR